MKLLILVPLLAIVLEDFRHRTIHLGWLAMLLVMVLCISPVDIWQTIAGFIFLLIQYGVLTLVFSLKEKRWVHILDLHIGTGDWVLLGILCLMFRFQNLMWFLSGSYLIILVSYFAICQMGKHPGTIPLAGGLSLLVMAARVLEIAGVCNLFTDGLDTMIPMQFEGSSGSSSE